MQRPLGEGELEAVQQFITINKLLLPSIKIAMIIIHFCLSSIEDTYGLFFFKQDQKKIASFEAQLERTDGFMPVNDFLWILYFFLSLCYIDILPFGQKLYCKQTVVLNQNILWKNLP